MSSAVDSVGSMSPNSRQALSFAISLRMYAHAVDTQFQQFVDIAQAAEALGFDGVYANDHFELPSDLIAGMSLEGDPDRPYFVDSWTALAAIGARTSLHGKDGGHYRSDNSRAVRLCGGPWLERRRIRSIWSAFR
jgi:hypothetical protein